MIKELFNWIKNKLNFRQKMDVNSLSVFSLSQEVAKTDGSSKTKMYLIDPTMPQLVIEETVGKTKLQMVAMGDAGGGFKLGTVQQQASACKGVVNNILSYMMSKTQKAITRWAATNSLVINPRAGKDLNAYYDRKGLKFFFFGDNVKQKNIFACDSRSVVAHEFGHAYLDILRPDFWSTQAAEIWAFHESFGDMCALLENLQFDDLINQAIRETNGNLLKSNILSRMALEMGEGLYNITGGSSGSPSNCLRDMSVVFNYSIPEKLPTNGPDNIIINECHSFSRIFSGAFYEMIIKMSLLEMQHGKTQLDAIKNAKDTAAQYLISATIAVPTTVRMFDALAKQFLRIDKLNGSKYQEIIFNVFSNRKILIDSVKILDVIDFENVIKGIKEPYEILLDNGIKTIRVFSGNKKIKLIDSLGISAQSYNPLFDLEIDIPNQMSYYFDENEKLTDIVQSQDTEIIDAAYSCLEFLHKNNMVGKHDKALFVDKNGRLVRKQIICKSDCGSPNYCDPNAPEYGKPWKPANNSGCVKCHSNCLPRPCCTETVESTPVKTGCYTSFKAGGVTGYKFGQSISRKVC